MTTMTMRMTTMLRRLFSSEAARSLIERTIKENGVVVFMKGTASKPMCGYSKAVCQVLSQHNVDKLATVNVLEDEDVRAEIKAFTNWPTVPQVFVKGQFIGGCDIVMEMHKSGELGKLLTKEGVMKEIRK